MTNPILLSPETPPALRSQTVNWPFLTAAIAWVGLIFFSSTTVASQLCEGAFTSVSGLLFSRLRHTDTSYGIIHLLADKGLHVTMFIVLATLLWRAIPSARHKIPGILLTGLVIGSLSEVLQMYFPGRDPAIRDVLINFGSAALGVWLNYKFLRYPSVQSS